MDKELMNEVCQVLKGYIEENGKRNTHIIFPEEYKDNNWGGEVKITFGNTKHVIISDVFGRSYCRRIIE